VPGAVLPICGEQGFPADLNETKRTGMPILLNRVRLLAFIAVFCVAWLNPAVSRPLEALSAAKKTVLINWRALKKWHVSESEILGEATVRYWTRSAWERHRGLILATAAVVGLQSMLIVGLIVQWSRLKRAERSLRDSEERMSLAAEAANLSMWVWDVVRDEVWMTDKGRAWFGIGPDTRLDYATLTARVHPEDHAARNAAIRCALERASRQLWVAWKVARNLKRRKHDDCC
jgi:PAS domain-containing protein